MCCAVKGLMWKVLHVNVMWQSTCAHWTSPKRWISIIDVGFLWEWMWLQNEMLSRGRRVALWTFLKRNIFKRGQLESSPIELHVYREYSCVCLMLMKGKTEGGQRNWDDQKNPAHVPLVPHADRIVGFEYWNLIKHFHEFYFETWNSFWADNENCEWVERDLEYEDLICFSWIQRIHSRTETDRDSIRNPSVDRRRGQKLWEIPPTKGKSNIEIISFN